MLSCFDLTRWGSYLECLDWIPIVSTASNIVHIFAKYACKVDPHTPYGNYLKRKTLSEDLGLLVPIYNIYIKKQAGSYQSISKDLIELKHVGCSQERRFPSMQKIDITSAKADYQYYASNFFINDEDIDDKLPYIKETDEGVRFTIFNKAIIQQSSSLTSFSACIQMLLIDKSLFSPHHFPKEHDLKIKECFSLISKQGIKSSYLEIPKEIQKQPALFMKTLQDHISLKGPIIIGVGKIELGKHFIIIDHISECLKFLRIRDPYHGWEITVKRQTLTKKLRNKIIQI